MKWMKDVFMKEDLRKGLILILLVYYRADINVVKIL